MSTKRKLKESMQKLPPIVIVPDKSYIDDTGHLISTDVIVLITLQSYANLSKTVKKAEGLNLDIIKAKMKNEKNC